MSASIANTIENNNRAVVFFENKITFETNPYGVYQMVQSKEKITIVDVRSKKDFDAGHIPGSINIPGDENNYFHGKENEFPGLRKDGYNIIVCYQHLCNLAAHAAKKFASLDYPVKEMVGGFAAWKDSRYPIEK